MNRVSIGIISVVLLLVFIYYLTESGYFLKLDNSKIESFSKCLADNGVVMYGSKYCTHCKAQKAIFGNAFKYINYIECTENVDLCTQKGIKYVPAWIINGEKYTGEMSLERLSELSGCKL